MKRKSFVLLIFFMTMHMGTGFAKNPVSVIDTLNIEIWPDYDKTSVLVLLTGTLPGDTRFPASVTLPLPQAAQLNAVARIDTFPARAVPAGQPFSLHVEYEMTTAQLSATSLPPPNTGIQTPALPVAPGTGSGFNWALVAIVSGGLIIILALIWQIASRRSSPDIHEPDDSRVEKQSRAEFCRNCGEPVDEGDRFCSGCGLEL